jgi:hypothetical protein
VRFWVVAFTVLSVVARPVSGETPVAPPEDGQDQSSSTEEQKSCPDGKEKCNPRKKDCCSKDDKGKECKEKAPPAGYFRIPGTVADARVWTSVRMQIIHDINNAIEYGAGYDCMHVASILIKKINRSMTRFHMKETRFGVEGRIPATWNGADSLASFFLEGDLYGAQNVIGGENTTNQALLRVRHAYVRWGPLLVGQYWGAFCDHDAFVDVVDFAPPVGGVSLRSPQIRYTSVFGNVAVAATLENPEGEYLDVNGKAHFTKINRYFFDKDEGSNLAVDRIPDLGLSVVLNQHDGGHMSFRSSFRQWSTRTTGGKKSSVIGIIAGAGGVFKVFGRDEINAQVNGGRGVGRYLFEVSGTGAFLDKEGELRAQPAVGGMLAYKHFWTRTLYSVLAGGYIHITNHSDLRQVATTTPVNKELFSASANVHWHPPGLENMRIGAEYLWGMRKTEKNGTGNLSRVMIGVKADL